MPTYDFVDESGQRVEVLMNSADAPHFGGQCVVDGRRLTRVVSMPRIVCKPEIRLTSQRFGDWEGYDKHGNDLAPRRDANGCPQFASRREVDEFTAKWNQTNPKSTLTWDPD